MKYLILRSDFSSALCDADGQPLIFDEEVANKTARNVGGRAVPYNTALAMLEFQKEEEC